MPSFAIADCPTSLTLTSTGGGGPGSLAGTLTLTIRNTTAKAHTGRVLIEPDPTAKPEWFSIEGASITPQERALDFEVEATQTVKVTVAVPAGTPGGRHLLRLRVTAEHDPDNDFVESGAVAFTVPEPQKPEAALARKFPWWIVAVGGAVAAAAVLVFLLYPRKLEQPDLAGKMLADARQTLVTAGYAADAITDTQAAATAGKDPGAVVAVDYSQSRKATLTTDPGVEVPALMGVASDQAKSRLLAAQLTVGTVTVANHPGAADNTVTQVNPAEHTRVRAASPIGLELQQTSPKPQPEPPPFAGELMLVNAKTLKCLTIAGGVSTGNNVESVQFDCDGDPSRRWTLKEMPGGGIYQVKNVQTGKCLTIAGGRSTENNVTALQFDCDGDPSRTWRLSDTTGKGVYQISNVQTKKCLTIAGGESTANNVTALQFNCDTDMSRRWTIRQKS